MNTHAHTHAHTHAPHTQDVFNNSHRLVVLVPTGDVVLKETWLKALKPDGHYQGVCHVRAHALAGECQVACLPTARCYGCCWRCC